MIQTPKQPAILVVLEQGATWPSWVDGHRTDEDTVVIAQQSRESMRDLLGRVQQATDRLSAENRCIRTAVFGLRPDGLLEARSERALIACSLLRHVCTRDGVFVLSADSPAPDERHELLALCGVLTEALTGTGTAVLAVLDPRPVEWQEPPAVRMHVRKAKTTVSATAAGGID